MPSKQVLFVDDDRIMVMVTTKMLQRMGLRVASFTEPGAALEAFTRDPAGFDLVVSDVHLGNVDAFDMCARLRSLRPDLRIILTSGLVQEDDCARARALGLGDVLPKSECMTQLPKLVAQLLG